jgi:hypothetical protein
MDRLLAHVKDIQKARFYEIQNVADYFWQTPREHWSLDEFNMAPPFPFFATHWIMPETVYSEERGRVNVKGNITDTVEILTVWRVTQGIPLALEKLDQAGFVARSTGRQPYPGAKWHYDILCYPVIGRDVLPPCLWFLALDERGLPIDQPDDKGKTFWRATENLHFKVGEVPLAYLHVSGLALMFIHTKNVRVLDPPPPSKKRLPRKVRFESRYHRIKILPFGKRSPARPGSRPTGIHQALHIRPGQFRHYGPASIHKHHDGQDRGLLFGRIAGRFWVDAHIVGTAEQGVIQSDYEVIAPPQYSPKVT